MLPIRKEIRCVCLTRFEKDPEVLATRLEKIKREELPGIIRYGCNSNDKKCMEVLVDDSILGYTSADDHRFIEPLLRNSPYCEADFYEVVQKEGHTPFVRFIISIDLEEVRKLEPSEEWYEWNYPEPYIENIGELSTVNFAGHLLLDALTKNKEKDLSKLEKLIDSFAKSSRFDMSVDTSNIYDSITFCLELSRERNRQLIDKLQYANIIRRTDKMREKFLKEWWPKFLYSEAVNNLCKELTKTIINKYGSFNKALLEKELLSREKILMNLPQDLYFSIDNIGELWAKLYYTLVPKDKFLQLLSGLVLRNRGLQALYGTMPFVVNGPINISITNNLKFNSEFTNYGTLTGDINE